MEPILAEERKKFHKALLDTILTVDENGIPSNADKSQRSSRDFAKGIANKLVSETGKKLSGQSSGHKFEKIVADYINHTFPYLIHLRPGNWQIFQVKDRTNNGISQYAQYHHLGMLEDACKEKPELQSILGNDYLISPDIVMIRGREADDHINKNANIIDNSIAQLTDLRLANGVTSLLHASISTKWTLRSDRAQNARSEALNLIRNRKGQVPKIMVVTGEPTPSRLSSIALGTGDIDCVYHFALFELKETIVELGNDEALSLLNIMIEGKRLKDISDLPFDLAI